MSVYYIESVCIVTYILLVINYNYVIILLLYDLNSLLGHLTELLETLLAHTWL